MGNQVVTEKSIVVHGRGSLTLPYKVQDSKQVQIDISRWTIFFEVDGVPIREQLVADPSDAKGQLLKLERIQVATLRKTPTRFAIIDETRMVDGLPFVLWEGVISRTGYVGDPDMQDGV